MSAFQSLARWWQPEPKTLLASPSEGEKVRTVRLYLRQQIDMLTYERVLGIIKLFYIPGHVII